MPEDCPPCSDEIKETCPDQDAATTSTCDVICDERYRSTPFLDKISTTGTRAPNGKCVYRLDGKPGFVVSDAEGQFITLSPCNLLERLTHPSGDTGDNFTFPFMVAVDDDGCMKQVTPPTTLEHYLPFWNGSEFTWIEHSVLLSACRNSMPPAPAAPLTGLGHLAFVTDTGGEYCVTMLDTAAADGGGYVQVDAAGEVIIADLPPYPTAFTLPTTVGLPNPLEEYVLGMDALGNPTWVLNAVMTLPISQEDVTPMPKIMVYFDASAAPGNTVPPLAGGGTTMMPDPIWTNPDTYFFAPDGYRNMMVCTLGEDVGGTGPQQQLNVWSATSKNGAAAAELYAGLRGELAVGNDDSDYFLVPLDGVRRYYRCWMLDAAVPYGRITGIHLF